MNKVKVTSQKAPSAIGPYSQAIRSGNLLFLSGQIPLDPKTGEIKGDINEQTKRCLDNIKGLLEDNSLSLSNVIKSLIFITDMKNFAKVNEIYSAYFTEPYPARSCVEVKGLPKGAEVEIEVIAVCE
jgi:2-iminobutanoate/2-iminopropanoate deaminase